MLTLGWTDGNSFLPVNHCLLSTENPKYRVNNVSPATDLRTNGGKQKAMAQQKMTDIAIHLLKEEGVNITATAIYTAMQAFMAGKAGARYAAPYVNRLDNMGADGVQVATDIHNMFRIHNMESDVLAASFKNSQQVLNLCRKGIGAVTAAPDVLRSLIKHDATFTAEENFEEDYYSLINEVKGFRMKKN